MKLLARLAPLVGGLLLLASCGSSPAASGLPSPAGTYRLPTTPTDLSRAANFQVSHTLGNLIATECSYLGTPLKCQQVYLEAVDQARAQEGLGALPIPPGFFQMSQPEQFFVILNLERVTRGLSPIVRAVAAANQTATAAAAAGVDPMPPLNFMTAFQGSVEAESSSTIMADLGLMYDDGWGNSGSNFGGMNVDCTSASAPGCWGHRQVMLMQDPHQLWAGIGYANSSSVGTDYTGLYLDPTYLGQPINLGLAQYLCAIKPYPYYALYQQLSRAGCQMESNPPAAALPIAAASEQATMTWQTIGQRAKVCAGATCVVWSLAPPKPPNLK
ncbi:MAG: hypothetical protein ACYCOS_05250 [Sulfobacillus sp.]